MENDEVAIDWEKPPTTLRRRRKRIQSPNRKPSIWNQSDLRTDIIQRTRHRFARENNQMTFTRSHIRSDPPPKTGDYLIQNVEIIFRAQIRVVQFGRNLVGSRLSLTTDAYLTSWYTRWRGLNEFAILSKDVYNSAKRNTKRFPIHKLKTHPWLKGNGARSKDFLPAFLCEIHVNGVVSKSPECDRI